MRNAIMDDLSINIIANAVWGPEGLSGSDRIFIESARRWAKWGYKVNIFVWEDSFEMCKKNALEGVSYIIWPVRKYKRFGFAALYLIRTFKGCFEVMRMSKQEGRIIVYSASDFWPDSIPGFIMSRRLKNSKWIGSFYLFAPKPLKGFKSIFYYFSQKPIIWLLKKFADLIFVTYDLDKIRFEKMGIEPSRIKVIYGGVDVQKATETEPLKVGLYDGCFVGRFHPQKGLFELIKSWNYVCRVKMNARLAIIGLGDREWEDKLHKEIRRNKLEANIDILGFLDGKEKYEILKSSKVYLCTNLYDSGGMATIEAMAAKLPVVSFNTDAIRSLIPKGTIRVPFKDTKKFAEAILMLLQDEKLYRKLSEEAFSLANEWDWNSRAKRTLGFMEELYKINTN